MGVGHVEHMTAEAGQAAADHGEGGGAAVRVAAHGLVNHDRVQEGGMSVALRIVRGQVTVLQRNGVHAFNAHTLGQVGNQRRIPDGNIRSGIDRGRAQAVGSIGAAVHSHCSAAPVCPDGCGGAPGGSYSQVFRIGHSAAGGHDAAGTISGGGNGRTGNIQGGTVPVRSVPAPVSAVAEDAVRPGSRGFNRSARNGRRGSAHHQHCRVQAVKVAVVSAIGIACLCNSNISQVYSIGSINHQGTFVRCIR